MLLCEGGIIQHAMNMVSNNPARLLGISDKKGNVKEGYDADLVMLDRELNVVKTWVKGNCCFSK